MTRWLTLCVYLLCLSLSLLLFVAPERSLAGNFVPRLYLEVYSFVEDPTDPGPVPGYVCIHERPAESPWTLPCYAARLPYNFYAVPIHIGSLSLPICATTGMACQGYGGFLGLFFGISSTGTGALTFMSWNACPGFLKGPSAAGEPAACGASSTALCHDWVDHEGYLVYMNLTSTAARYLNIVANADLGHTRVINCHNQYDMGTVVIGGAQIGGAQTITCDMYVPVEELTWGKIKGLFR
jgi:hypothetical protein